LTTLSAQYPLALWNERDPILKERAFGLTNSEGNHGEDVKDCYFDLDRWLKEHKAHPLVSCPINKMTIRSRPGQRFYPQAPSYQAVALQETSIPSRVGFLPQEIQ
jgi:hypothetical protein